MIKAKKKRSSAKFESEVQLAERVIGWLENMRWDVYQEVEIRRESGVADIVAIKGPVVWVIECKLSLGLPVIGQAMNWIRYANTVSVCVPDVKSVYGSSNVAEQICRKFGLGMLMANPYWDDCGFGISERVVPQFRRKVVSSFRDSVKPEHKTYAKAGTNSGKRWTPFQQTCASIRDYVKRQPGTSMKDLLENITTHYGSKSTARSCLFRLIEQGVVQGVRLERDGRKITVHPEESKNAR